MIKYYIHDLICRIDKKFNCNVIVEETTFNRFKISNVSERGIFKIDIVNSVNELIDYLQYFLDTKGYYWFKAFEKGYN